MCTVTFIPTSNNGFVFTSNRDEAPERETLSPQQYVENGVHVLFPKDKKAGGTWIGIGENKRLVCLLNGGFTAHERGEKYRLSRGILVIDLLTAASIQKSIDAYNFKDIEPFTLIAVDWKEDLRIFELVWDGSDSHFSEKPLAPQIWSSSLLYSQEMKKERELWFSKFLFEYIRPSAEKALHFHKQAGAEAKEYALVMDRGFVKTKSISQIVKNEETVSFQYEDLQKQTITKTSL